MNASTALNGTGSVTVACTKGSSGLTVAMSNGVNVSGTQRRMPGATSGDLLNYNPGTAAEQHARVGVQLPGRNGLGHIGREAALADLAFE